MPSCKKNLFSISYILYKSYRFFFLSISLHAQTILVHVGGGLVNYGGDLQSKNYSFNQANGFIQGGMSLQWSSHYIIDYSIAAGKVGAKDANNPDAKFQKRNLS